MIALTDADSLMYKVGFAIEDKVVWNEAEVALGLEEPDVDYFTDIEQCKETFARQVSNILFATGCDSELLVMSGKGNFRLDLPTSYKENRKETRKPLGYKELRAWVEKTYTTHAPDGMEADDYVVYMKTAYPEDYILCAIDKDVLYQTEGTHYNYGRDEEVTVSQWDAVKFAYYQCLTGDVADGYKGANGIGPKKAEKILAGCETEEELWEAVLKTYEARGHTADEALWTMRLANMHQFDGNKVVLWEPQRIEADYRRKHLNAT